MTNKNDKTKFQLHAVFVQANTISGYRYLDLSGIVLNRIANLYSEFAIDPAGCVLRNPKNQKDPFSVRFSTDRIWLHYTSVDSLTYVVDTAPEWVEGISKDIEVARFSRLGLRSEFFSPCTDIVKATTELSRKVSGAIFQNMIGEFDDPADAAVEFVIRVPLKQFVANIRATIIKITRESKEPTDYKSDGILFDVDIYRRGKLAEGFSKAETKGFLKSATDHTYDVLERIGYSLLEV